MSSHYDRERIAADLLIAQMQINGTGKGFWTSEHIAKEFQTIYNQIHDAETTAIQRAKNEPS